MYLQALCLCSVKYQVSTQTLRVVTTVLCDFCTHWDVLISDIHCSYVYFIFLTISLIFLQARCSVTISGFMPKSQSKTGGI